MPGFPGEHLPNEVCDLGLTGLAGQARVILGQHPGGVAGLPIKEEEPAGLCRPGGITAQASADVVFHSHLLREGARPGALPRENGEYAALEAPVCLYWRVVAVVGR